MASKIRQLFEAHGGVEEAKSEQVDQTTANLREAFVRGVVQAGLTRTRRYCMGDPCTFDIILPYPRPDFHVAQLMSLAMDVFSQKYAKNHLVLHINHTSLLRAIALHFDVKLEKAIDFCINQVPGMYDPVKYNAIKAKSPNFEILNLLKTFLVIKDDAKLDSVVERSPFGVLLSAGGEVATLAEEAFNAMKPVIIWIQMLRKRRKHMAKRKISISVRKVEHFDHARSGGIIWALTDDYFGHEINRATGECYDSLLLEYQKEAGVSGGPLGGAGLTLHMRGYEDKENISRPRRPLNIALCVLGTQPAMEGVSFALRYFVREEVRLEVLQMRDVEANADSFQKERDKLLSWGFTRQLAVFGDDCFGMYFETFQKVGDHNDLEKFFYKFAK